MPRVVIVDDHEVVLKGLAQVVGARPGWDVVGQSTSSDGVVELVRSARPDVAVFDFGVRPLDGAELTRQCLAERPGLAVLIYTMSASEVAIRDCLAAGARGFLLKSEPGRMLDAALDAMAAGEPFLPGPAGEVVLRSHLGRGGSETALTPRERQVLAEIARGLSGKEVAIALGISPKTVEIHRAAILDKLDLRNVAELTRYAVRNGLVEP